MKNTLIISLTAVGLCFSLSSFAQATGASSTDSSVVPNSVLSYVKIEVGMHILDCPVLPKSLKAKLLTVKGIKDYQEDQMTQSIYFNMPQGAISKDQILNLAKDCAFPPASLVVLMADKPFTN